MKKLLYIVALLLFQSFFFSGTVAAKALDEYSVKAAFIYNFCKFSRWAPLPATEQQPFDFTIGVVGKNPFNDQLLPLTEENVHQRPIKLIYLPKSASSKQLRQCQVLFIDVDSAKERCAILKKVHDIAVLTISDHKGFSQQGGCIEFSTQNKTIRFILNRAAIEQQHIEMSYKVYSLAVKVLEAGGC